jgi:sucrose-6-phosphate hydrolase SacC (GH32 family)
MPGDPNCAFFYKDRYHLHYIYRNQQGFAFAHVSSDDMVTWKWHTTVLAGSSMGHGMFSGTGFFTKEGRPAIIYHGQGSGRNHIAYGMDDSLDQWSEPQAIEVKTADGNDVEMRHWDPDCWINGDTYYAISGGGPPHLIKSKDLEKWSSLGLLLHEDTPDLGVSPDEDVSCANMFKIGERWMLLCISHKLGCRYYLGDFKDEKYLPDFHAMMNWKDWNFFAPESLLAPDGRRIMWAWCRLENGGAQTAIQCLPRELSLPEDGLLRIKPLRELEKLRYDERRVTGVVVKDGNRRVLDGISGNTIELRLAIKPSDAERFGVEVFCTKDGKGFPISLVPGENVLLIGDIRPPIDLPADEEIDLRVFLDKSMVEVFVNDRQAAVYMQPHEPEDVPIRVFSKGGEIEADVTAWKMRSIYEGR